LHYKNVMKMYVNSEDLHISFHSPVTSSLLHQNVLLSILFYILHASFNNRTAKTVEETVVSENSHINLIFLVHKNAYIYDRPTNSNIGIDKIWQHAAMFTLLLNYWIMRNHFIHKKLYIHRCYVSLHHYVKQIYRFSPLKQNCTVPMWTPVRKVNLSVSHDSNCKYKQAIDLCNGNSLFLFEVRNGFLHTI
jgi:hypothetical protein